MSFAIAPEQPADAPEIEALVDLAFGEDRQNRAVARLRAGRPPIPNMSFTARNHGQLVGSIRFWDVALPDGTVVPLLGPLAVRPELRGEGIGRALVTHGLTALRLAKTPAVLIVGDPGYYAPFKFSVSVVRGLRLAGPVAPLALMGREFQEGVLSRTKGKVGIPVGAVAPAT